MTAPPQNIEHIICGPDFEYCGLPEFLQAASTLGPASLSAVPRPVFHSVPYAEVGHLALLVGVFCWPRDWSKARAAHVFALVVTIPFTARLTPALYMEWVFAVALAFSLCLGAREEFPRGK